MPAEALLGLDERAVGQQVAADRGRGRLSCQRQPGEQLAARARPSGGPPRRAPSRISGGSSAASVASKIRIAYWGIRPPPSHARPLVDRTREGVHADPDRPAPDVATVDAHQLVVGADADHRAVSVVDGAQSASVVAGPAPLRDAEARQRLGGRPGHLVEPEILRLAAGEVPEVLAERVLDRSGCAGQESDWTRARVLHHARVDVGRWLPSSV